MLFIFLEAANETYFSLTVKYYHTSFFEIKQVKACELDSLVGNIGGYIGLLLGYVILSLPSIFLEFLRCAKNAHQTERLLNKHLI